MYVYMYKSNLCMRAHGLRTPGEEIAFTARPKFTPTPKFLGTAEAYFVCHIGPSFQNFFDLCLHWVSVVRVILRHCAAIHSSLQFSFYTFFNS